MTAFLAAELDERELLTRLADHHRAAEEAMEHLQSLSTDLAHARAVEAALTQRRARMAADLSATGVPLRRIAAAMGVGLSTAAHAVRRGQRAGVA